MIDVYLSDVRGIDPYDSALLEAVEKQRKGRIERFARDSDKKLCLGAGLLIAQYVGLGAISRDSRGKPHCKGGPPFSLSHSGDYVLLAVGAEEAVGCDIEQCRALEYHKIAARAFSPEESSLVEQAADPAEMFFRIWTLRESYLKATGEGIAGNPLSVCFQVDSEAALVRPAESTWMFREFSEPAGYQIAVCGKEPIGKPKISSLP